MKLLAWCGILGPPLFTLVFTVLGALYPGYDHLRQQMSALGARGAPHAALFNIFGLGLTGLLTIAFAAGLQLGLQERGAWIGPALVALGGASLLAAALLRCEPGCVGGTLASELHQAAATGIGFLAVAPLAIAPRLRMDARWQRQASFSLVAGLVSLLLVLAYGFSQELGLGSIEGALQRAVAGAGLFWMEVLALHLLRTGG